MSEEGELEADSPASYIKVGYLTELLRPWTEVCNGDEWGEYLQALYELARSTLSIGGDNDSVGWIAINWMLDELKRAWDEDWWGQVSEVDIYRAQDEYQSTTDEWRTRAESFGSQEALAELIDSLPNWLQPEPGRPKVDPGLERYRRLKAEYLELKARYEPDDSGDPS